MKAQLKTLSLLALLTAAGCSVDHGFDGAQPSDAFAVRGAADGFGEDDVAVSPDRFGYSRVTLRGATAEEVQDAMVAARFPRVTIGETDYRLGRYTVCAGFASGPVCALFARDVEEETGDYRATIHGRRFDSAASELFGALAASLGVSPGAVSEVEGDSVVCRKSRFDVWCGLVQPRAVTLELALDGLDPVGPDFVYEGWLITPDGPVSAGRFDVGEGDLAFEVEPSVADGASLFVLTIEPAVSDDPAPADTHVLAGALVDGVADLAVSHPAALGTDFAEASGGFILGTPSTAAIADDYRQGVWFLDPAAGPGPSLLLPALPAGWVYEGWAVGDDGPQSTGRFLDPAMADSDGAGPAGGPDPGPPFPGQDFIDPPRELPGHAIVLSVEPEPDPSPLPFAIKPLAGGATDAGPGVLQALDNIAETTLPTGTAFLR